MDHVWVLASAVLVGQAAGVPQGMDEVRRKLLEGDLAGARSVAQGLVKADRDQRQAWEFLGALAVVAREPVPDDVKAALSDRRPSFGIGPAPSGPSFVGATSVRVRAKPDPSAALVAELPMNTPVEVKATKGEWAQVKATAQPPVILAFAPRPAPEPVEVEGWLLARFLAPRRLTLTSLVEEARRAEKWGAVDEAARLYERASFLDPGDVQLAARWARTAFDAGQFEAAVRAVSLSQWTGTAPASPFPPLAFFGCRGAIGAAALLESAAGLKTSALPQHACVSGIDVVGECAPLEPLAGAPFGRDEACDKDIRGSQSLRECKDALNAQFREHEAELNRWRTRAGRQQDRASAMRAQFPSTMVRFIVPGAPSSTDRLFAYQAPYWHATCQDTSSGMVMDKLKLSEPIAVPTSATVVWVEADAPASLVVGLVIAASAEKAREAIARARTTGTVGSDLGLEPCVRLPTPVCQCQAEPGITW